MPAGGAGGWDTLATAYVATIGFFTGLLAVSTSAQLFLGHLVTRYVDAFAAEPQYTRGKRNVLFVFQIVVTLAVGLLVLLAPFADSSRVVVGERAGEASWAAPARVVVTLGWLVLTSLVLCDTFIFSFASLVLLAQGRDTGAAFLVLLAAAGASDFLNRQRVRHGLSIAYRLDSLASWSHTRITDDHALAPADVDGNSAAGVISQHNANAAQASNINAHSNVNGGVTSRARPSPTATTTTTTPATPPQPSSALPNRSADSYSTRRQLAGLRVNAARRRRRGLLNFRLADAFEFYRRRLHAESFAAPKANGIEKGIASALSRIGAPAPDTLGVAAMQSVLPDLATRELELSPPHPQHGARVADDDLAFGAAPFASSQLTAEQWDMYQAVLNTGREPEWKFSFARSNVTVHVDDVLPDRSAAPTTAPGATAAAAARAAAAASVEPVLFRMVEPRVAALDLLHSFHRVAKWSHAPSMRDRVLRWVRARALLEWAGTLSVKPGFGLELLDSDAAGRNNNPSPMMGAAGTATAAAAPGSNRLQRQGTVMSDDVEVTWPDVWGMFDGPERPLYFREEELLENDDDVNTGDTASVRKTSRMCRAWVDRWKASWKGDDHDRAWGSESDRRFDRFGHASDWGDVSVEERVGLAHAGMHVEPPAGRRWRYWEICAAWRGGSSGGGPGSGLGSSPHSGDGLFLSPGNSDGSYHSHNYDQNLYHHFYLDGDDVGDDEVHADAFQHGHALRGASAAGLAGAGSIRCLGLKALLDDGSAEEETVGGKASRTWLALCLLDAVMCVKELRARDALRRPADAVVALGLLALGMIRAATKRFGRRRLVLRRVDMEQKQQGQGQTGSLNMSGANQGLTLSTEMLFSLGDVLLYMTEDAGMWQRSSCFNIVRGSLSDRDLVFDVDD